MLTNNDRRLTMISTPFTFIYFSIMATVCQFPKLHGAKLLFRWWIWHCAKFTLQWKLARIKLAWCQITLPPVWFSLYSDLLLTHVYCSFVWSIFCIFGNFFTALYIWNVSESKRQEFLAIANYIEVNVMYVGERNII